MVGPSLSVQEPITLSRVGHVWRRVRGEEIRGHPEGLLRRFRDVIVPLHLRPIWHLCTVVGQRPQLRNRDRNDDLDGA